MPHYIFKIQDDLAFSIGQVRWCAQTFGLEEVRGNSKLRYVGEVSPINARKFADFLDAMQVNYTCVLPVWSSLQNVKLTDIVSPAKGGDRAIKRLIGASYVKNLPRCKFGQIIDAERRIAGLTTMPYLMEVLRFMIDHNIRFVDLSPREIFRTPIESLELPGSCHGVLKRQGFWWAELFLYITKEEISQVEQLGSSGLKALEAALARENIEFWRY